MYAIFVELLTSACLFQHYLALNMYLQIEVSSWLGSANALSHLYMLWSPARPADRIPDRSDPSSGVKPGPI